MNLQSIKDTFGNKAGVALIGASLLFSPMAATSAHAQQVYAAANTETSTRAVDQVDLTEIDIRDKSDDYARVTAIAGSAEYAVLKLNSNDNATVERTNLTMRRLMLAGYTKLVLLVAQGENGFDNSAELYIAATNGEPVTRLKNLDADNAEAGLMDTITDFYPNSWKSAPYASPKNLSTE